MVVSFARLLKFVLISCSCDALCAAEVRLRIQIEERGAIGTAGQPRQLKADLKLTANYAERFYRGRFILSIVISWVTVRMEGGAAA